MSAIVTVTDLHLDHRVGGRARATLRGVDLSIDEGESFGLVGASGSGKTTIARALTGHRSAGSTLRAARLEVAGHDLLALRGEPLRRFRRDVIGLVPQDPQRALNPTTTVGAQIAEVHRLRGVARRTAWRRAVEALDAVGLDEPDAAVRRYPHELSGGQQQRVMIAMALAARPRLLLLDEPTSGLDGVVRAEVLALVDRLQRETGFASVLISHDLPLVAARTSRVALVDRGVVAETISAARLRARAERDRAVSGARAPVPSGAVPVASPLLVASRVRKAYGSRIVLDDVDLEIGRGETLGVVGTTGSGKSTLARAIAGLTPHGGSVTVDGSPAPGAVQMIFQNPDASLNPRRTVRQILRRAVHLLHGQSTPEELLEQTGVPLSALQKLPSQLSGGQRQRVAIARALAGASRLVVCDEPTSALDGRAQDAILGLLADLQARSGVSYLFISHDLAVIRRVAHRVAVMHEGRIVEQRASGDFFGGGALHPHSRALLAAARADDAGRLNRLCGTPREWDTTESRLSNESE